MQQPAKIQKALINTTASKYFSESCHINLIHYLRSSTKVPAFLQVSPRNIENLISGAGGLIRVEKLENASKKTGGGVRLFET